jgi:flagellar hook-associated protein 1
MGAANAVDERQRGDQVSTFSGLNTASTALWAAQRAMDVTGQNVANANTDGYSRQRVDLQSVAASPVPALWSTGSPVGQGVDADHVTRIRDAFLEAQAQSSHSAAASLTVQDSTLTAVQQAFGEPGDTGIQSQLSSFWAGFGDIANHPDDDGARSQLLERAQTLAAGIRSTNGTLDQQWSQTHDSLQALLTDVNATASSIAGLNQTIKAATQSGLATNELADKRDQLIMHLSEQIGASTVDPGDGTLNVVVGGTTLVAGGTALGLQLTGPNDSRSTAGTPMVIQTTPGGTPVRVGGTADGDLTAMTSIIPGYQAKLDAIAQQLATQVNTAHETGYDQDGKAGGKFFSDGAGGDTAVTAANLTVAVTSTRQVAAAGLDPASAGGTQQPDGSWSQVSTDNAMADTLFQQRLLTTGADAAYNSMITGLGVQATSTSTQLSAQTVISTNVDASRESTSGVNLDEEMTNMLQFQHGYAAAGKLVSTINQMLDDLMNMVQ